MAQFFNNLLNASFHGSIVIVAVILLRLVLRKTPKKYICLLWLLAGIRLLMPIEIRSDLSLQPEFTLPSWNLPGFLPWIWGVVTICFGMYSLVSYMRLKEKVREAVQIRGGWECDKIDTAFILGFIKPRIYIPMGMNAQSRKHILEHERTHLDKGDHWIKMIGFVALALHWFNPLVWIAYIMLCKDIEIACDERVVQFMELEERKSYSAALLSCSSRQMHFSANPVAFGEVSVKQRILSVLNYKKPSFWIGMLGVIAFFFVAVCLVTSPGEKIETVIVEVPVMEEPVAETTEVPIEETAEPSTFTVDLKQEDIEKVCIEGINRLITQESYFILSECCTIYPQRETEGYRCWNLTRRYGNDMLDLIYEDAGLERCTVGSSVRFGDMCGMFYGDFWVNEGNRSERGSDDINSWLERYSPEDKEIFYPEGTGIISDDSVSFRIAWCEDRFWGTEEYEGTFIYRFNNDGSITEIYGEYEQLPMPDYPDDEIPHYTVKLTIQEESPSDTYRVIQDYTGQCIPAEQLEFLRREQNKITEIPSNKTDYDRDFMLGSGQMRWCYFDEEWQFELGAENPTAEGLTLKYSESSDNHKSLVAEEGFWIEQLIDDKWIVLDSVNPVTNAPAENIQVSWSGTDSLRVDWKDSYGILPHGFYRLGRYHTVTMPDGRFETIHCYAKFRIYDPNRDQLLAECANALNGLLNSDSYHIYTFDWMVEHDFEYYLSHEIWKSGEDYLEVTRYPLRSDMSQMKNVGGSLWREGKHYGISWSGEPVTSPVSQWDLGVDGYITGSNVDIALYGFEWYDARVGEVYREGNEIHIIESYDFDEKYEATELIFTIENGTLKGIVSAKLPTQNCAESEKIICEALTVYNHSSSEIRDLIYAQDVITPMPFSYEEDVLNYPNAKKSGFKNTTAKPITTAAEALALADKESTMPQLMEFKTGYCQSMTYYDAEAKMWKVHLFWWQHDTAQTVYINDQGITQMIVSVE